MDTPNDRISKTADADLNTLLSVWQSVLDAILAAAAHGISKGELYACLMIVPGFNLQHFDTALSILTEAARINVSPTGWVTTVTQ